jgi:hypothetical protein
VSTPAFTVWLTGPDPDALDAVADEILRRLAARDVAVEPLDRRDPAVAASDDPVGAAIVAAAALARHGVPTIVALAAPATRRDRARDLLPRVVEVDVRPAARAPGDEPTRAEVEVLLTETSPAAGAERAVRALELLGLLTPDASGSAYSEEEEREVIRRLKAFGYL